VTDRHSDPADLATLTRVFGRIGILSFGGPAAQIALMHRALVDERDWLTEDQFLRALSFCMMLPGPEAMQLATYAGWRLRGVPGGLIAGGLFVLPGALVIMALALAYAAVGDLPLVQALFLGIKATVVVIVIQALLRLSKKALATTAHWVLAGLAFAALFLFDLPFPLVIALAAAFGAWTADLSNAPPADTPARPDTWRTVLIWGALWAAPALVLWALQAEFLLGLAVFFAKLAVVTFGGAYAVLAYMTQAVVTEHGWLSTAQMIDALGLAETTPGPLILVTQFVGHIAGVEQGGIGLGLLAGLVVLWMTFVPCFLWIFAGAPYLEAITTRPRIGAALAAVTAAVVGVILSLSLWFALHVFFGRINDAPLGLALPVPDLASFDPRAAGLFLLAAALLLWRQWPLLPVLGLMALAGAGLSLI